jgi:hypothetical protein
MQRQGIFKRAFSVKRIASALARAAGLAALLLTHDRPADAAFLSESATAIGTLTVSNAAGPSPLGSLAPGGASLLTFADGRGGGTYSTDLLKFDLAPLAGASIASATFDFAVSAAQATFGTPELFVGGSGSSRAAVTLADFPALGTIEGGTLLGGTGALPGFVTAPLAFHLDVTAFVRQVSASGAGYAAFLAYSGSPVMMFGDTPGTAAAGLRPGLSVTFTPAAVPEPGSVVLVTMGIVLACGRVARRAA